MPQQAKQRDARRRHRLLAELTGAQSRALPGQRLALMLKQPD
jgi:hypothetical protein